MNYIFGGIDGTGTSDKSLYETEFANSFVRQLFWSERSFLGGTVWKKSYYYRGPVAHGLDTDDNMRVLKKSLVQHLETIRRGKAKLVLAGYSRGGAAVTALARELGVDVHLLILFDAVSMTGTVDSAVVPANVKNCVHAIRDPATFSRHTWGNTARQIADTKKTNYLPIKRFMCTHGGMGGVPWVKPKEKKLDDLIDESYYDRNNVVARTTRSMPLVGPIPVAPLQNLYESKAWTKVTYRRDHAVSKDVKVWMAANIQSLLRQPALTS